MRLEEERRRELQHALDEAEGNNWRLADGRKYRIIVIIITIIIIFISFPSYES